MYIAQIFRRTNILLIILVILVFSCSKDTSCPDDVTSTYLGWTVGESNDYGLILHTKDGGKTWTRQGDSLQLPNTEFQDICIIDKNTLLVVGDDTNSNYNVFKSVNRGETWIASGSGNLKNVGYEGIFALDKNNIWIVGQEGSIYYSTDVADTWTKIEVPAEYQEKTFNRIAAKSKDDIWVTISNAVDDSFPILLHTTDGGINWEPLNPLKDLFGSGDHPYFHDYLGIKIFGNSIWAVGGFGRFIIRSADNGSTWEDITVPGSGGIYDANDIFLLSETEAYVVQDFGLIFSTNDAGMNWTRYYAEAGGNWVLGIAILNNNNIWICGSAGAAGQTSIIKYSSDAGTTWQDQTPQLLLDNIGLRLWKIRFIEVNE